MIIDFNPILESQGGVRLRQYKNWNDPANLETQYMADISEASAGFANYQVVERLEIDDIPVKTDGFHYTDTSYLDCLSNSTNCHADTGNGLFADYLRILTDYDVCGKRNRGEIDELWLWGGPYFGYYEAIMTGPNAFWVNGGPLAGSSCTKQLNIMGFNYERGVSEMLEDFGHRAEGTMAYIYGGWTFSYGPNKNAPPNPHMWDQYSARGFDTGISAGCGNIHGSLNTPMYDPQNPWGYDWTNQNTIQSRCEDFNNYPNLTGQTTAINCNAWGCESRSGKKYWLAHLPKYTGLAPDGKLNNWWKYAVDYEDATAPRNLPKGHEDIPGSCTVNGWTCDPDKYSQALSVKFYENGTEVGSTTASNIREQAVGDQCGGITSHGFSYIFPDTSILRDGNGHTIYAKANDIDTNGAETGLIVDLLSNGQTVTCSISATPTPSPTTQPSSTPSPSPSFTAAQFKTLMQNYLTNSDADYLPSDGKVNMLDGGYVMKWINSLGDSPNPSTSASPCAGSPTATLISPANGLSVVPEFSGYGIDLAAAFVYNTCNNSRHREIWTRDVTAGADFTNLCYFDADTGDGEYWCRIYQPTDGHTYEWYAVARNENSSVQSNIFSMTVSMVPDPNNQRPIGYHDAFFGTQDRLNCRVAGWATDPDDKNIDLEIKVWLRDHATGVWTAYFTGKADKYRADLETAGACPGGTCAFDVDISQYIPANSMRAVVVRARDAETGEWIDLGNTNQDLTCSY